MSIWSTIGNVAKGAAGFIPGVGPLIQGGLAGINAIAGAGKQGEANEILRNMLAQKEADRAARAPFRNQLLGRLSGVSAQRPDLSGAFQTENPFGSSVSRTPPPGLGEIPKQLSFDDLPPELPGVLDKIQDKVTAPTFADAMNKRFGLGGTPDPSQAPVTQGPMEQILGRIEGVAKPTAPTTFSDAMRKRFGL